MGYIKLICRNCGNEFVWSQEEQDLYAKRRLAEPEYCPICRGMMEAKSRDKARQKFEA